MKASDEQLTATAERAIRFWDLGESELTLVSRSENVVFKVERSAQPHYALCLHRPGYNTFNELRAECTWTEALSHAGIRVPRHRYTTANEPYAQVLLADTQQQLRVGMIEWIDGVSLGSLIDAADDDERLDYFRQLGGVIAQAHNQAVAWEAPSGFTRRRWDADGLMGADPLWGQFWRAPQLSHAQGKVFAQARAKMHSLLTDYGEPEAEFSLVHADLHPYNMLVDGVGIQIIDFDDCGYSWHLYDIAVALYNYRDHPQFTDIRDVLVAGYRAVRPLGGVSLDRLPVFFLIRSLVWLGWINGRPELLNEERVHRHVQAVATEAQAFLQRAG
jgi:Ser/Thr protein kinase RdoA (MazF antagonist)